MTLTKADKKEIAKMIADIINTQNSTQTSLKDNLPDFKNWSDEAIVLDCGIIAIIASICVGRNIEWTIPVRLVGGEE